MVGDAKDETIMGAWKMVAAGAGLSAKLGVGENDLGAFF